jgi:hypothetical protein
MAPVLAITGMVAWTVGVDGPLTPLERFFKPIVTGPNRIPFSTKESRNGDRQEAVAEPEGEKGMGTTVAIGRPWA